MSDKPLLIMHQRYEPDSQDIWREAIRRGWRTERAGMTKVQVELALQGKPELVRYYGNMLHLEEVGKYLPIKFHPLDINNLTKLEQWTKRKIELKVCSDITQPLTEGGFYKATGIKWLQSRVYNVGETFECKPTDTIYKQSTIDIVDEIRTFVIDGQIQTASWYRVNKEFDPKPVEDCGLLAELSKMATEIWNTAKWPKGVVFDFGQLRNGEWCFIEANEAYANGLYMCNPSKCFDTIIASQE